MKGIQLVNHRQPKDRDYRIGIITDAYNVRIAEQFCDKAAKTIGCLGITPYYENDEVRFEAIYDNARNRTTAYFTLQEAKKGRFKCITVALLERE